MPKEITMSRSAPFIVNERGDEIAVEDLKPGESGTLLQRGVHVGWDRERNYVELGAATFNTATHAVGDGLFLDLNRDGVNRLIRTLRKARDQAFGADA